MSKKKGKGKPKETGELEREATAAFHCAMEAFGIESNRLTDGNKDEQEDNLEPSWSMKGNKKARTLKWSSPGSSGESVRSQAVRLLDRHRSDSNDTVSPAPAASAPNEKENNEDDEDTSAVEELLIRRVRHYFDDTNPSHATLSIVHARRLLEASSGDLDLAAGFYWDEYFANTSNASSMGRDERRASKRRSSQQGDSDEEGNDSTANQKANNQQLPGGDLETDGNDADRGVRFDDVFEPEDPLRQADEIGGPMIDADELNNHDGHDAVPDIDEVGVRERAIPGDEPDVAHNVAGSVSVSDDEAGAAGIWRMAGRRNFHQHAVRTIAGDTVPIMEMAGNDIDTTGRQQFKSDISSVNGEEGDDEDGLSDGDWLLNDELVSSQNMRPPTEILWGISDNAGVVSESAADHFINPDEEDEDENRHQGRAKVGIHMTWLNTGFYMAKCGTGLKTKEPPDDDFSLEQLQQQRNSQRTGTGNENIPTFHCRGITALPSIVTAMMYTGTSVQGNVVDCTSSRTPFVYLSENERIKEFESRLVDALTALLHIALKSSTDRKKRILEKEIPPKNGSDDGDRRKKQMIRRKLRLCPTCHWKEDGTGEPTVPSGKNAGHRVLLRTSYTSVDDLRAYVLSNMRSFTGKGGCALLLETIVTIHGSGSISRMIKKSRRSAGLPTTEGIKLVTCNCNQHRGFTAHTSAPADDSPVLDSSPINFRCMSIELLSLLLTGTVHSTLNGWSTGALGFGILSNATDRVGTSLARPEQPVWIVCEDSCYNVIWLDRSKSDDSSVSQVDKAGNSFYLVHWNAWFGTPKRRSGLRVITARQAWSPPIVVMKPKLSSNRSVLDSIMERRTHKPSNNVVSSDEHEEASETSAITEQEMLQVKAHPDDQKYYPRSFKRWRYDVEAPATIEGSNEKHAVKWTPFHKLTCHQQNIVEMNLAPTIARILWTRWPKASVDSFEN